MLKRLIAINLLLIHITVIVGQLAMHQYLAYRSDQFFNQQIAKNYYNIDDLVEVKVPVNMPHVSSWSTYQNLCGQVKFAYASYNYVKIKLTGDAIYLMVIPNYETTRLNAHNIIYADHVNVVIPKKDHVPPCKINYKQYSSEICCYEFSAPVMVISNNIHQNDTITGSFPIRGPAQPPDSCMI